MGSFFSGALVSGSKEDANMTTARSCNENERLALLDFKANLVDINNSLHDWGNKEKDCCQWVGVKCNKQTGHVTELDLSAASNGLSGCSSMKELIPNRSSVYNRRGSNSTGCLPLQKLDLSRNGLTGTLPLSVGKLLNLEHLDVSSNSLNGSISNVHFLNLTQLTYLDLSFNSFELNLSSQATFGFKLNAIKMQSCKLGPGFPMWVQTLSDFEYLDISNAGISDRIPGWFWDLPPRLRFLNLSSNEITGTLPNMTSVFDRYPGIDLSYNQLEGTIPMLPSKLAALNLSRNKFSGTLSFLCQIDKSLTFLDLSNNFFSGSIPDCLQKFQENLVVLNLSNNSLSGEIPSFLGSLSKLQAFYLRNNAFVGEIPAPLSNCTKLKEFQDDIIGHSYSSYVSTPPGNQANFRHIKYTSHESNLPLRYDALDAGIPVCGDNCGGLYYFGGPNEEALFIDNALVAWKGTRREFGRGHSFKLRWSSSKLKLRLRCKQEYTNRQCNRNLLMVGISTREIAILIETATESSYPMVWWLFLPVYVVNDGANNKLIEGTNVNCWNIFRLAPSTT
ncbi:hypothetical protein E3N88_13473 [Mikania micrantha]|uniref:Leucine-rich repeat-containing N-terminal plant-type domain-containing protein n=1 Tax=Mikania micrantha TaxID=192012 RepID=A0A5N6PAG0_9ASTR|nr:hypothetical protein E3N88_13473 [Mikania micrantha]